MKCFLLLILICIHAAAAQSAGERIPIDAKINGKPVCFVFDTGVSTPFVLSSSAAHRLKLKVARPPAKARPAPGQVLVAWTAVQKLDLGFAHVKTSFAVVNIPPELKANFDGLMGWPALMNNVFSLDCADHTISFLKRAPQKLDSWIKCRIQTNSDLTLQLPGEHNPREIVALDTGAVYGVQLNPEQWQEWKAANATQPMTVEAYYTPNPGLVVAKEGWANNISLGPLTLSDVPVMKANSADVALHLSSQTQYEATLGFAALKRLDIIIDGKRGVAYLRPKKTPPLPYEHNRLGAVFVPKDLQSDDLVAHVIDGSPAYEAGIRNGDMLLKIDERDVTNWRDPSVKINTMFSEHPAGTRIKLTLKRDGKIFKTTAVLQNIFPVTSTALAHTGKKPL